MNEGPEEVSKTAKEQQVQETQAQEALVHAGQRRINLIWEYTQAMVAIFVVGTTLGVASWMVVRGKSGEQIPTIFSVAFGTIVGFYFGRTNHSARGGIGVAPRSDYDGR